MVNTVFDTWSFTVTGSTTSGRTQPDRESDIVNVKDWGATGDGATTDTTAIQAAIDYCITRGVGQVFFPIGNYKISSIAVGHASIDIGVQLIGAGLSATMFSGSSAGFVISSGGRTKDCLELVSDMTVINNQSTAGSGAIQITRTGAI